jgi:hypothetical protein
MYAAVHWPLLACLLLATSCTYNQDTQVVQADVSGADAGSVGLLEDCSGFAPSACGECGLTSCRQTEDGAQIECVGNDLARPCPDGEQTCTASGACIIEVPQVECDYDGGQGSRPCGGECGVEFCTEGGTWSGVCVAQQDACTLEGTQCLETSSQTFECLAVCSTAGHDTPCVQGDVILPLVPVGTQWTSRNGCVLPDACRLCECVDDGEGGARVDCHFLCDQ